MPGVASILNKAVADDARIHLFYNTDKSNLGLLLRDGTQNGDDPDWELVADTNHSETGIIPNQSSLSATFYRDVKLVFAITSKTTKTAAVDTKAHDVSIVSPVYKPLTSTDINYFALASTSIVGDFHVFFLGTDNDDKLVIKNYTYTTRDSNNLPNSIPAEDTDLAAYTVGRASYVIYQSEDKSLNEYNVERRNTTRIETVTGARKGTPLAATHDNTTGRSYLYYVGEDRNQLFRLTKTKAGADWGSPQLVDAPAVNKETQLTATLANNTNHLFYIEEYSGQGAAGRFYHALDDIGV